MLCFSEDLAVSIFTASQPRKPWLESSPPWRPQTSHLEMLILIQFENLPSHLRSKTRNIKVYKTIPLVLHLVSQFKGWTHITGVGEQGKYFDPRKGMNFYGENVHLENQEGIHCEVCRRMKLAPDRVQWEALAFTIFNLRGVPPQC
jgi:hypothetical protein